MKIQRMLTVTLLNSKARLVRLLTASLIYIVPFLEFETEQWGKGLIAH
ncbi:hypothetical protein [Niallia sp. FSL R7-0271]